MSNSDFNLETESFLNWFRNLDGATFHSDIAIKDLRDKDAGRGIVATADIEPDTVLFTIPRKSIICAATSELPSKIPGTFNGLVDGANDMSGSKEDELDREDDSRSQNSWTSLILILMYEHFKGHDSSWKAYLDILPTSFDTLMAWSPEDLSQLQASSIVSQIGREEADKMIENKIIPIIRAHGDIFLRAGQIFTNQELMGLAHRMGSTIMAYAFDLEKDEDDDVGRGENEDDDGWVEDRDGRTMMGMVPMADVLNADAVFNAHISHGEHALTATALRRITVGEQILNYYGSLSNGELLRRYGYVTPRHSWFDIVELPWNLVESQIRQQLQLEDKVWQKVLKQVDIEDVEDGFVIEWGNEEPDSTGHLHGAGSFHGLPDELGKQFKLFFKAIKKVKPGVGGIVCDRGKREEIYLNVMLGALKDRESQYATTIEEDGQMLEDQKLGGRYPMAIRVRSGEKLLLREAQSWTERKLRELGDLQPRHGPAAKRQKTRM